MVNFKSIVNRLFVTMQFFYSPFKKIVRASTGTYTMPSEEDPHEATWLQWPHNYGWDTNHVKRYEKIWIDMTKSLHTGENVYIIVYNKRQKRKVGKKLKNNGIEMSKVKFFVYKTDDVWVRDNGPIFAYDNENNNLVVQNWKFNGWGKKADWSYDNKIPKRVSKSLSLPLINVSMVNEGGSIELDGRGTLMAKRSSILNKNRNPGLSQSEAEEYFRKYIGVSNFIWLDGTITKGDITDDHIDGTARFANGNTIVTYSRSDFIAPDEYDILIASKDVNGKTYDIVTLPLTKNNNVGKTGEYGIYINYYIGNEVILMPVYNDPNDDEAKKIIGNLYPNHEVVGILAIELFKDGGMTHCVTQQQPSKSKRR